MLKTTSADPDTVWLLRVSHGKSCRTWLMYSETVVLRGKSGESRAALIHRWIETYGPLKQLVRYSGVCYPYEAAYCMAQDMIHVPEPTGEQHA